MDAAFVISRNRAMTYQNWAIDRLRGMTKQVYTDLTNTEASDGSYKYIDNTYGLEFTSGGNLNGSGANYVGYFYQRAPQFFDVVAYTGNGTAGRTVGHNLGVVPEMMWIKQRDAGGGNWWNYHKALGNTKAIIFSTSTPVTNSVFWNNTSPTDTVFSLGSYGNVNGSGANYIAYLFATLDGVSKVGSYTGNGSSQTIDCGFSNGASYIMIKRTDSSGGDWFIWDSSRGIVSGNDPYLGYNLSGPTPENNSYDSVDPNSSGFNVVQNTGTNINVSSATYIFHAIA
jgi:hypothetical protein